MRTFLVKLTHEHKLESPMEKLAYDPDQRAWYNFDTNVRVPNPFGLTFDWRAGWKRWPDGRRYIPEFDPKEPGLSPETLSAAPHERPKGKPMSLATRKFLSTALSVLGIAVVVLVIWYFVSWSSLYKGVTSWITRPVLTQRVDQPLPAPTEAPKPPVEETKVVTTTVTDDIGFGRLSVVEFKCNRSFGKDAKEYAEKFRTMSPMQFQNFVDDCTPSKTGSVPEVVPAPTTAAPVTEAELGILSRRAVELFGAPLPGARTYSAQFIKSPSEAPRPNCVRLASKFDSTANGTFVRWKCMRTRQQKVS